MDTGQGTQQTLGGWQVVKRETDGDLFLIKGTPGDVTAAWGPLHAVTDSSMFKRTEDFTTIEELPELEYAGSGGRSQIRGGNAA